jgi:histidinol-phosphate aminotransferase
MTNKLNFIRPHIQEMLPYEPILPFDVLSSELGIPPERLIKLDANENPYGSLPEVKESLAASDALHIYPDPESRRIRKLLAVHHQVRDSSIVVGAGADELIDLIMRIVIEPGDIVINCPPTFGMYAFDGALNNANLITVPRRADFSLDLPGILQAVEEHKPRLLFLANPNNPDGGMISVTEFRQLVNLPLLLVMDEAYIQFIDRGQSVLKEVESHNNLIVMRTFSKWAGLAGLRIGYGVFPEEFVPMLMRAKQPYNVSVAAEQAAVITMQNLSKAEENIAQIIKNRGQLFQALAQFTWLKPYPSQANFILCRVEGVSAFEVKQRLRKQGILIRYFDKPALSDHIRISIGTQEQIQKLITALKGIW